MSTSNEVKSIKTSGVDGTPCKDLELKLSAELDRAICLNAKTTFENNSTKLIIYGLPHGRNAGEDIRHVFGEDIKRICANSADATRLRTRGQTEHNDRVPPVLLEFRKTRIMRECKSMMRESLRAIHDKNFVKSVRIEEFLPSELLPWKNHLHKLANSYKQRFNSIKLFRVSLSRKYFD